MDEMAHILSLPPIYLLPTHLSLEKLHELEDQIPTLTYDIKEAKLVLGKVTTKQRAEFELRSRKYWTEEVVHKEAELLISNSHVLEDKPIKRRKVDHGGTAQHQEPIIIDSSTESENGDSSISSKRGISNHPESTVSSISSVRVGGDGAKADSEVSKRTQIEQVSIDWGDTVKVVKLAWFIDSQAAGDLLPLDKYLVYEGKPIAGPPSELGEPKVTKVSNAISHLKRCSESTADCEDIEVIGEHRTCKIKRYQSSERIIFAGVACCVETSLDRPSSAVDSPDNI
jgi:DNA polymerase IV